MRLVLELVIVAGLVALGWSKSFSERVGMADKVPAVASGKAASAEPAPIVRSTVVPAAPAQPAAAAAPPRATATPDNSWMWDPNRPGSLDRRKASPRPRP